MKDLSNICKNSKRERSGKKKPERRTLASIEAYIQLLEKQVS